MPLLTPSRALVVLVSFLLVSFLWTFGLPHQYATPTLPITSHGTQPEKPVVGQLIPEPLVEGAGGGDGTSDTGKVGDTKDKDTPTTLTTKYVASPTISPSAANVGPETSCKDVRGASDVMVIVRTSKAEMDGKVPVHLKTLLSCVSNFAIFSDYAETIDGFPLYDALDTITNTTKSAHNEFLEYDKMQEDKEYRPSVGKTRALDKWKFLPMVYKTAVMVPSHRFYFFIEADTSLSWTNLLQWLDRPDYRIPYYSGAPKIIDDKRYAQHGPGIMLSYGALQQYITTYEERYVTLWESHVGAECCGDLALAKAMKESRVEYYSSFPLLQTSTPSTLDWTQKFWCTPIVSWQHMSTAEIDTVWDAHKDWTQEHGWAVPYVHRNAFEHFVKPNLAEKKDDWDNISSDTHIKAEKGRQEQLAKQKAEDPTGKTSSEKPKDSTKDTPKADDSPSKRDSPDADKVGATVVNAADSPSNCQAFCHQTDDCLQWKHTTAGDGECHLGKALRLGAQVEHPKADEKWTSGFILDRITKVTDEWGRCEKPEWRFNQ
ncbi:hypothetical protein N0V90_004103 [Kalmusia sp. IMI 367209]|nr:hypothetical protein N0V90_004103 [Kalmusia sp. IMI 367209]